MSKSRRIKGEGSIYKDNQGYWNAQLLIEKNESGKPIYKKFRSKKQAAVVDKLNEYKLSIGKSNPKEVQQIPFENLINAYLALKKGTIRETSFNSLIVTKNLITDRIGGFYVSDITPELIQESIIADLTTTHAYSTIHKVYVLLNECMKYALDKDYIVKNPCTRVKMPHKENFKVKEIRCFTDDEIESFKKAANQMRKTMNVPKYQYGNITCLVIYTGLRVSELCALKWSDIDFSGRKLIVSKSIIVTKENGKRKLIEQNTTKSGKSRLIPLNDKALAILEKQKALVGCNPECYIVNGQTKIADKADVSKSFGYICKSAGIQNSGGIHTLRHTFASLAIRKGVDIKVVSEILGHASTSFTYNTYVHVIEEQKIDAVDLLNSI